MSKYKIVPLDYIHLDSAAELFLSNYQKLRKAVPCMPDKGSEKEKIISMLTWMIRKYPGVAAIEGNKLIGYLSGIHIPEFKGRDKGVYCPEWGHGAESENHREIYRKMYEAISDIWIENDCLNHALTIMAYDKEAIDTWFWNGFGLLTVDVVRDISPVECNTPENIKVRKTTLEDVDMLMPILQEHIKYYRKGPVFLPLEEMKDKSEVVTLLSEPDLIIWMAEDSSGVIGFMMNRMASEDACNIVRHEKTVSICGAYVKPEKRGHDVGSLIVKTIIDYARENGYERCSLDFEAANIYGSKFWLRHFTPVCNSLIRHVDDRITDISK